MARHDEYDRDKSEQGVRVAADIFFENSGYRRSGSARCAAGPPTPPRGERSTADQSWMGCVPASAGRAPPASREVMTVTPRCRCGRLLRATAGWMARCEVCRNGRCPAVYQGRRCRRPWGHRGVCQ